MIIKGFGKAIWRTAREWQYRWNPLRLLRERKLEKARRENKPFIARMPGINLKVVIRPHMYFSDAYAGKIFEPGTIRFMKKNIKKSMVALDIGANVGYFTLLLSRLVGPQGKVIAFEPGQYAYELLKKNININGFTNIVTFQLAVSDVPGEVILFEGPEGFDVYNSLRDIKHPAATGVHFSKRKVRAVTIDDILAEIRLGHVDFVKIDVEGAELNVIRGMRKTLEKGGHMILLFECADTITFGYSCQDLVKEVKQFGFRCWKLDDRGRAIEMDSDRALSSHMIIAKRGKSAPKVATVR